MKGWQWRCLEDLLAVVDVAWVRLHSAACMAAAVRPSERHGLEALKVEPVVVLPVGLPPFPLPIRARMCSRESRSMFQD
jgi:hypothetical protein